MKIRSQIIFLLYLLNTTFITAQPYCDMRSFNIRDGLAANVITGICQNKNDLMWFSTWNGICCFDGYSFSTFKDTPGMNEVLTSNRIKVVKPNVSGDIWCLTFDNQLYLFSSKECRFINFSKLIQQKFNFKSDFRTMYTLSNGYTWAVSKDSPYNFRIHDQDYNGAGGIIRVSRQDHNYSDKTIRKVMADDDGNEWLFGDKNTTIFGGKLKSHCLFEYLLQMGRKVYLASTDGHFSVYYGGRRGLTDISLPKGVTKVNEMSRLDKQRMLIATNIGVIIYDTLNNRFRVLSIQSPNQPSAEVKKMFVDSKGRIWAFGTGDGITMIDGKTFLTQWMNAQADQPMNQTTSKEPFFMEDKNHYIWLVPNGGTFSYYDTSKRSLIPYKLGLPGQTGAQQAIVRYYTDNQKNLWFTSTHDLTLVRFKNRQFHNLGTLQDEEVRAVMSDHQGNIWVGTYEGHLVVFSNRDKLVRYVSTGGTMQQSPVLFTKKSVYALFEDSKHRVWVGTKGDGIYVINGSTVRHYANNPQDRYSLSHNDIYCFDEDRYGRVWVGTYKEGLNIAEAQPNGNMKFYNHNNSLSQYPKDNNKIRRITHTAKGVFLIASDNGIVTCSDHFTNPAKAKFFVNMHVPNDTTTLSSKDVLQTLVMRNGHIYVTSLGGCVQEIVSSNLLQTHIRMRNLKSFSYDEGLAQSLVEDNHENLWIIREGSIDKYIARTGVYEQFGPNDLGEKTEFSEAKPYHNSKNDIIHLGSRNGLISFSPSLLKKSHFTPQIIFTNAVFQGETGSRPILNTEVFDVPSDNRNLTIYFSALDYSDNYLIRYAYKLDGIDKQWNYVGNAHSASFNQLPPGHLKLLVRSTNSDGVWVNNVKTLNIYSHPTFLETIWAKLLYILLFGGIVYIAAYIYRLRNKAAMDRELSDMKLQFFTEISHKLRTPLTLIGGPITEVLNNNRLEETAKRHLEMVQRNAKWMLDLVNKMLDYSKTHNYYISDDNAKIFAQEEKSPDRNRDAKGKDIKILIVEDNEDLRAFLHSILNNEYRVVEAENGQIGLDMAVKEMPDFILTDVMMPVMDGLTMVHQIKGNKEICHIPIIVLSAKASLDDRLQGLKEGIDDYITKPFSAIYLKQRVKNIISQRKMLQQTYIEQIKPEDNNTFKLDAPQIVDADKEMMKKLLDYLNENLDNADMKIEDLADTTNLGRTIFYGKIKSLTGMSPIDFVKHIRMQRAEELIKESRYTISQISYMVGFSDPKYFSRSFKKETGMTPSDYRLKT